jgi:hypothetical protein
MHPVCNVIMHALLVAAWFVVGYCAVSLVARPCVEFACVAAVQLANASVLLWFVWPRKVVGHG